MDLQANHNMSGYYDEDTWDHTFDEPGEVDVFAYVYNIYTQEDFTWWMVTVVDHTPEISRVYPSGSTVSLTEGESITFEVEATDEDGDLDFFEWYLGATFMVNHNASGSYDYDEWIYTFDNSGTYYVYVYIYDDWNNEDFTYWKIIVEEPHEPEIFRVNPSSSNVDIQMGEQITFEVYATDEDGDLDCFKWYLDEILMANHSASGSYDEDEWGHIFTTPGNFQVDAYIYDSEDNYNSTYWMVSVDSSSPEIFRLFPSQSSVTVTQGDTISFYVSASDVDGDLDFFEWYLGSEFQVNHDASGEYDEDTWFHVFTESKDVFPYVYDTQLNEDFTYWTVNVQELERPYEFFDDFTYTDLTDMLNDTICDWVARNDAYGPGLGYWNQDQVSIINDSTSRANRLLRLSVETYGDSASTIKGSVLTENLIYPLGWFLDGTYAARVCLHDAPVLGEDGDACVQTFYTQSEYASTHGSPFWSEIDYEYLPNSWSGQGNPQMDCNTWEQDEPSEVMHNEIVQSFEGWHTLIIQVSENSGIVMFVIDGELYYTHNGIYYPESSMFTSFSIWLSDDGLLPSSNFREYQYEVDWIYHCMDLVLAPELIDHIVEEFRSESIDRRNTMPVSTQREESTTGVLPILSIQSIRPNPVRSALLFEFTTPSVTNIELRMYGIDGRLVCNIPVPQCETGVNQVVWDANQISAGIYFIKLSSGGQSIVKRFVVFR
ncbi:MAG: T9SS type A sorting domain-containing protein [Candidatus Aegiribacteria sp.]|nr:T9SS type A sorting domain-containing protein [Candidatus Aegiribacteria sp.]